MDSYGYILICWPSGNSKCKLRKRFDSKICTQFLALSGLSRERRPEYYSIHSVVVTCSEAVEVRFHDEFLPSPERVLPYQNYLPRAQTLKTIHYTHASVLSSFEVESRKRGLSL
jgi:hypothetical protein